MNFYKNITIGFLLLLALSACEDVVDIETDDAPQLIVVDAWLNNRAEAQTIRLTFSQPYFDSTPAIGISGAIVSVESDAGDVFNFVEQDAGNYIWLPEENETIGEVGTTFTLNIGWQEQNLRATSVMNRVPEVDSITQEYEENVVGFPDGIYAEFYARDFEGAGDTYWIKTFKNGQLLNKPSELNLAYDAGFSRGSEVDGLIFIPPIREDINETGEPDEDESPWASGDSIRVEIHSLNEEVFDFMIITQEQTTNGDNTIFAVPLANTTGNVTNLSTGEEVLGIFCVSALSSLETIIE